MMETIDNNTNKMTALSKRYADNTILRSVVSMLPSVGGGLDIILSAKWNSFHERRVEHLLILLSNDLESLENKVNEEYLSSEEFYDIIFQILSESLKTRLDQKREIYSKIIRDSISLQSTTMKTESILEIVSNLYEMDLAFIFKIESFKDNLGFIEFSGEDMLKFLSIETFDKNETVRILFRFSYLGLLDYKMNILTLREKVKFTTTPFFECILSYLKE